MQQRLPHQRTKLPATQADVKASKGLANSNISGAIPAKETANSAATDGKAAPVSAAQPNARAASSETTATPPNGKVSATPAETKLPIAVQHRHQRPHKKKRPHLLHPAAAPKAAQHQPQQHKEKQNQHLPCQRENPFRCCPNRPENSRCRVDSTVAGATQEKGKPTAAAPDSKTAPSAAAQPNARTVDNGTATAAPDGKVSAVATQASMKATDSRNGFYSHGGNASKRFANLYGTRQ